MKGHLVKEINSGARCTVASQKRTVGPVFPDLILKAFASAGGDVETLMKAARTPPALCTQPGFRLTLEQYSLLVVCAARQLEDEALGCLRMPIKPGTLAVACELALNARTVARALDRIAEFYRVVCTDLAIEIDRATSGHSRLQAHNRMPERDPHNLMEICALAFAGKFASWLAGRPLPPVEKGLSRLSPEMEPDLDFVLPCPTVQSPQPVGYLIFSDDQLAMPVVRSRSELTRFLRHVPLHISSLSVPSHRLSDRVYLMFASYPPDQLPSVGLVSKRLGMSEPTLRRNLAFDGESYQRLKDRFRQNIARRCLHSPNMPTAEVAERLGFSTPGAFNRAFRQWTGVTPEAYRAQRH